MFCCDLVSSKRSDKAAQISCADSINSFEKPIKKSLPQRQPSLE